MLFKTRNSTFWGSPEFRTDFVFLSEEAARALVDAGVRLVGIDYLSIEEFRKPGAPAHKALLSAGIVVVEGLESDVGRTGTVRCDVPSPPRDRRRRRAGARDSQAGALVKA